MTTIATTLASDVSLQAIHATATRPARTAISFTAKVEREDSAGNPHIVTACFIDEIDGGVEDVEQSFYGTALIGDSVIIEAVELDCGRGSDGGDDTGNTAREAMPLYRVTRITDPYGDEIVRGEIEDALTMLHHYRNDDGVKISALSTDDLPLAAYVCTRIDGETCVGHADITMRGEIRIEATAPAHARAQLERMLAAVLAPTVKFIAECGVWELVTHTSMRALELAIAREQFAASDVDFVVSDTSHYFYARVAGGGSISVNYDTADDTVRASGAPRTPSVHVLATSGADARSTTMAEFGEHVAFVARAIDPASTQPAF